MEDTGPLLVTVGSEAEGGVHVYQPGSGNGTYLPASLGPRLGTVGSYEGGVMVHVYQPAWDPALVQ